MKNVSGPAPVLQTLTTLVINGSTVEVVTVECYPPGGSSLAPRKIDDMVGHEAVQLTVKLGGASNASIYIWIPVTKETQELLYAVADEPRCLLDFTFTSLKPPFPELTSVRFGKYFYPVYKDKEAALASL